MRHAAFAALVFLTACATTATSAPVAPAGPIAGSPVPGGISPGAGTSLNPADAPAGAYTMDPRHTSIVWRVRHQALSLFTARFDNTTGTLNFDPANPANSTINVTIAANSISTGIKNQQGQLAFDGEIARALGAEANPNITFVSRSATVTGPTTGLITGDLTLNGQTHPVTLEAIYQGGRFIAIPRNKHVLAFSGRTIINRSEWGVTAFSMFTGDQVEIVVNTEFVKD